MVRVFLVIVLLLVIGLLAEGQYRSMVVRPDPLSALAADSQLVADLASLRQSDDHFAILDLGNALTKYCSKGTFGCYDPSYYARADVLIALSPTTDIRDAVRILDRCDRATCVALKSGDGWIRPATSSEVSQYAAALKLEDRCAEEQLGQYAYLMCVSRETVDGKMVYAGYSIGEPYPKFAPALVLDKMAAIETVQLNFVTGKVTWTPANVAGV